MEEIPPEEVEMTTKPPVPPGFPQKDQILYDLLIPAEWTHETKQGEEAAVWASDQEKLVRTIKKWGKGLMHMLRHPLISLGFSLQAPLVEHIMASTLDWHMAVAATGQTVALLRDTKMETRAASDNFISPRTQCIVGPDKSPQWRRLACNPNPSQPLLAIATAGRIDIADHRGKIWYSIPLVLGQREEGVADGDSGDGVPNLTCMVAAMVFVDARVKSMDCVAELLVLDFFGNLTSYLLDAPPPKDNYRISHSFSFKPYHDQVACMVYDSSRKALLVAGYSGRTETNKAVGRISYWRLLADAPYYDMLTTQHEDSLMPHNVPSMVQLAAQLLPRAIRPLEMKTPDIITSLSIRPDQQQLAAVDCAGHVMVWELPSFRPVGRWSSNELQHLFKDPPEEEGKEESPREDGSDVVREVTVCGVAWWDQSSLILFTKCGRLVVAPIPGVDKNMLGPHAEKFEPGLQVSPAQDGRFLVLECERRNVPYRAANYVRMQYGEEADPLDAMPPAPPLPQGDGVSLLWSLWLWLLRFANNEELGGTLRLVTSTYRLVSVNKVTPQELFTRKVRRREYQDALWLADVFGLNTDILYQQQWREHGRSNPQGVKNYLDKVSDTEWVLRECAECVPQTVEGMRTLLQYGIERTHIQPEGQLSPEQAVLVHLRRVLLDDLDRLATYETIMAASQLPFVPEDFNSFRDMSLVEIAHDFAQMERYDGLEIVQTYHGAAVLPHRLDVLSSIPDPADPQAYTMLLPKCERIDGKATVVPWEEKRWREKDWSEDQKWNPQIASAAKEVSSGPCAKRRKRMGESLHLSTGLTVSEVTRWYVERTRQIDRLSGQLDVALKLIGIGIKNNVPALEELQGQASSMCVLVYGLGCVASDVTLEAYEALSNNQRLALLLADCKEDKDVVSRLKGDGMKFVLQLFAGNDRPDDKAFGLLRHQMAQWAKGGSLGRVVAILKARNDLFCDSATPKQGLLAVHGTLLVETALECLVACSPDTENEVQEKLSDWLMKEIKKLPPTSEATIKKVQTVDGQLRAVRILDRRGLVRPVAFFGSCTEQEAKRLVEEMVSTGVRARPAWDRAQWRSLLKDLADLQRGVLHMVPLTWCLHQYLDGLLGCARSDVIELAREVLLDPSLAPDPKALAIPMAEAEPMVLKAAREYFNSARSYNDPSMGLAQACLRMLPPSAAVSSEQTLVRAVEVLASLGVADVLPVQLRLSGDKTEIVRSAIRAQPDNYCKVTALKSLGLALGLCGDGPMDGGYADILAMAADRAIQVNEYDVASEICDTLMEAPGHHGWAVCHQLGRIDRPDTATRRRLLTYALQTCPPSAIAKIMPDLTSLERRDLGSGVGETQWVGQVGSALARLRKSPLLLGDSSTAQPPQPSPSPCLRHDFYSRPRHQPPPTTAAARRTVQPKPFPYQDHPTRISQQAAILRLHTLADQGTDKGAENLRSCRPLLVDLCVAAAAQDCRLFVAYVLAMWNGEDSRQVFRRCAPTEDTFSLAAYFYALQAYCAMQRSQGHTPPLSTYRHSPKDLVQQLQDAEGQGEVSELVDAVMGWLRQLADCRMEQRIKGHAAAVDMARFGADETYRQDIITQLVSQPSSEAFSTALALAKQYHLDSWELAYRHAKAMFELNPPTLQENIAAVQDLLLQRPSNLVTHVSTSVYPNLPGTQLSALSLYLRLLTAAREADPSIPEPHSVPVHDQLKIVTQLSACNLPGVDFKALISAEDPLTILEPYLSDSTVSALATCVPLIPTPTGPVTSSLVYRALVTKMFGQSEKSGGDGTGWQSTYDICRPYFDHMTPQDALPVYTSIAGPSAISVPAAIRLSIARDGLKWAQSQDPQDEALVSGLQSLVGHLQWVADSPLIGQLAVMGGDYVLDYDRAAGNADALDALGIRLAVNGGSLSLLQSYHSHRIFDLHQPTTIGDTLLAAADCATAAIFRCDRPSTLGGPTNPVSAGEGLAALRHVLADVAGLDQWDGPVKRNDITGLVLGRASDTNYPGDKRLAVLSLLQEQNLHQVEGGAMQHIRAQAIINDTWGIKVDESAMATPPQQEALFNQLLSQSTGNEGSLLQLAELLVLWDGPAESSEGVWTQLLAAMGQCSGLVQPALSFLLPGGHAAHCRSNQMEQAVVSAFVSAGHMGAALQVAVGSKQEGTLVEIVVAGMKAHKGPVAPIDPTLLYPLLARPTLLAPLVQTPYWPEIVNALVTAAPQGTGPTSEGEQAHYRCGYASVVAGLVVGGSMGNAVSLSLRYFGIRPSLFSWDSGLVTLRRLLDTPVGPISEVIPSSLSWVPNSNTVTDLCSRAKASVFQSE